MWVVRGYIIHCFFALFFVFGFFSLRNRIWKISDGDPEVLDIVYLYTRHITARCGPTSEHPSHTMHFSTTTTLAILLFNPLSALGSPPDPSESLPTPTTTSDSAKSIPASDVRITQIYTPTETL